MPIVALSGLLSNFSLETVQYYLLLILILCISLSFHEVAHGWVAYRLGDDTAALQGRLTLNPLRHLDPIGSLAFLFVGIGWAKPVPINPRRFDRKYTIKQGLMLTSIAGPAANILLALAATILYFLTVTIGYLASPNDSSVVEVILQQFFYYMYFFNVVLAVFNLLPIPPLDGFKIFGALLPNKLYYRLMNYERYIGLVFLFLVIFARGTLSTILSYIRAPFNFLIWEPVKAVFEALWGAMGLL